MKRLNPKTGNPFKRGEVREDGKIFFQYLKRTRVQDGFFIEAWLDPEKFKLFNFTQRSGGERTAASLATILLCQAKGRCKGTPHRTKNGRPATNGVVTIDKEWIQTRLEKGVCEATGDLLTCQPGKPNTASLDRIDPKNPDYTPENARIVTWQFNNMKGAYSDEEFIRIAEALKNVKQNQSTPVSKKSNTRGKD